MVLRLFTGLVLLAWILPAMPAGQTTPGLSGGARSVSTPESGRLLVATDEIQGAVFGRTVILLLHYGDDGAMGLVINRPTDVSLDEVTDDVERFEGYSGDLFWGGPVQMDGVLALAKMNEPPEGRGAVVGSVVFMTVESALQNLPADTSSLRFYIGYAGWAPGQLDAEMARGSWTVIEATDDRVFADDPATLWQRLTRPGQEYRVTIDPAVRRRGSCSNRRNCVAEPGISSAGLPSCGGIG